MSDAKELREAIDRVRTLPTWNVSLAYCEHIETVIAAAEAHLATLPREVEVDGWVLVDRVTGKRGAFIYPSPKDALDGEVCNRIPLRLVGKAFLPGSKE